MEIIYYTVHLLSDGFTNAFGIYMPFMINEFKSNRYSCSIVGALLPALTYMSGPIGAWFINKVGCQSTALIGAALSFSGVAASTLSNSIGFLYVSIGIVTAIGFGIAYVPVIAAINMSFDKNCATAMGLATSGCGVGTIAFPFLTGALLRTYGLRGTFLISSAILANIIPAALLLKQVPKPRPTSDSDEEQLTWFERSRKLLCDCRFVLFAISNFLTSLGFNAPYIFMNDYALLNGISELKGEWLVSIMGIMNIAGRIIMGKMGDWKKRYRLYLYNICLVIAGVASMLEAFSGGHFVRHALFSGTFGFFSGGYVCLTSPTAEDLIGKDLIADAFGYVLFVQGTATLIGPPLCGWLYEWNQSYKVPFMSLGTAILVSGLMLFVIQPNRKRILTIETEAQP
ncbi:hypothetical protein ACOME3_002878 [Neoechinorhynchus agilis]